MHMVIILIMKRLLYKLMRDKLLAAELKKRRAYRIQKKFSCASNSNESTVGTRKTKGQVYNKMTDSTEITTDDDFSTTTDATTTDYTNPINTFKDSLASDIKLDDLTKIQFQWYDYLFFFMLLALSVLIGLYYAFFSRHKQNNTKEYILGGKTLKVVPVAISLISS